MVPTSIDRTSDTWWVMPWRELKHLPVSMQSCPMLPHWSASPVVYAISLSVCDCLCVCSSLAKYKSKIGHEVHNHILTFGGARPLPSHPQRKCLWVPKVEGTNEPLVPEFQSWRGLVSPTPLIAVPMSSAVCRWPNELLMPGSTSSSLILLFSFYTRVHKKEKSGTPLNICNNKRKPAPHWVKFCTHSVTSIWVTNAKFHRNLSFSLRGFHFWKWFTHLGFQYDLFY